MRSTIRAWGSVEKCEYHCWWMEFMELLAATDVSAHGMPALAAPHWTINCEKRKMKAASRGSTSWSVQGCLSLTRRLLWKVPEGLHPRWRTYWREAGKIRTKRMEPSGKDAAS